MWQIRVHYVDIFPQAPPYPTSSPPYPTFSPPYPTCSPPYPTCSPLYPTCSSTYPACSPAYPTCSPPYPTCSPPPDWGCSWSPPRPPSPRSGTRTGTPPAISLQVIPRKRKLTVHLGLKKIYRASWVKTSALKLKYQRNFALHNNCG